MFKVTVIGAENVPKEGGLVLCANHISVHDPVTMALYIRRQPRFIAKKEIFENRMGKFLFTNFKAFPVDRSASMDMKAFKQGIKVLKSGEILGIFAEGTRVKEGEEKTAKAGVAMFAVKSETPIVPVAIWGKYKFRSRVFIRYGEPMMLEEYREGRITTEKMEEMTGKVMARIKEMKNEV